MAILYDKLVEYSNQDYYPFHMPGHKRNVDETNVYGIDITEIDGFDNMHNPQGIIKTVLEKISKFYESDGTYFLVNGSTGGILSAISSAVRRGGKILVARNCHKSVYNAIYLNDLMPVYVYPDIVYDGSSHANIINGGINPKVVEELLKSERDIEAVVITSPTYEGIVTDVKAISSICHKYKVPLIVDEAHGAHFDMHSYFPQSALSSGADIVIQSLHKTLPTLTQTGLIHINSKLVNKESLEKFLSIYQTSSPSYVLMTSMEKCLDEIFKYGDLYFEEYVKLVEEFRESCKKFTHIKLLDDRIKGSGNIYDIDRTRLVIFSANGKMSGKELYGRLLNKYHIQMEMAAPGYAVAITSVKDTKEGFDRLLSALTDIDRELRLGKNMSKAAQAYSMGNYMKISDMNKSRTEVLPVGNGENGSQEGMVKHYSNIQTVVFDKISSVDKMKKEKIYLKNSIGKIAADYVYIYPPGIPVIAPGEMINNNIVSIIDTYLKYGFNVNGIDFDRENGLKRNTEPLIKVVKEDFKKVDMTEIFGKKVFAQINKP